MEMAVLHESISSLKSSHSSVVASLVEYQSKLEMSISSLSQQLSRANESKDDLSSELSFISLAKESAILKMKEEYKKEVEQLNTVISSQYNKIMQQNSKLAESILFLKDANCKILQISKERDYFEGKLHQINGMAGSDGLDYTPRPDLDAVLKNI